MQPPYTPYLQGVSRMAIPSSFSGPTITAPHLHRGGTSSFASHEEFSQTMPAFDSEQGFFDEPPPPYTNSSQIVHPLSNAFQPPTVLSTDRFLNLGPMTSSPLAPVPLRHSSLYQVLKHESPASPRTGTIQSRVSSLAHALEPQHDPQARQAPLPASGDRLGSYGISAPPPNASQMTSTSLNLVSAPVDPCSNLVQVPRLSLPGPVQTPSLVSAETRSAAARASAPAQNLSVVTPMHTHTLAPPFPEVTTHDYDTLPRLRKVSYLDCSSQSVPLHIHLRKTCSLAQLQPALPGSGKEDHSAASSPLSSLSSRPSSSTGAPAASSSSSSSSNDTKSVLESAFTLPLLGRKRPVLRAKLACLFCRRRKIQCRPLVGDRQSNTCQ